jgi:hypothetical protein
VSGSDDLALSLVRGDALLRAQRAIGLVPKSGLGIARRALALALFAWLPIALWALWRNQALPGAVDEPLLQHFGIHVRALLGIPLLVLAEGVSHGVTTRLMPQFVNAGLVRDADQERFRETLRGVARLRDRSLPWVVMAGFAFAVIVVAPAPAPSGSGG